MIVGLAIGGSSAFDNEYIVSYDPEYHPQLRASYDGGKLVTSPHADDAKVFSNLEEVINFLRSGPSCNAHRTRPDGQPNRPLTAFNIVVV